MKHEPFIVLPTHYGEEVINPGKIISICSDNKSVIVIPEENPKLEVKLGISEIQERLDQNIFIRCHRSYIVNLFMVKKISAPYTYLVLKDAQEIPIARRNKTMFKKSFEFFQKNGLAGIIFPKLLFFAWWVVSAKKRSTL